MSQNFKRGFKSWSENTSKQIRQKIGLTIDEPLDPWKLAEYLKIIVWYADQIPDVDSFDLKVLLEDDPDSWSALTLFIDLQPLIILNPKHTTGRQSNTICHEISHIILDHKPSRVDVSEEGFLLNTFDKEQEHEADWLAGTLLLPRDALIKIKYKFKDLNIAANYYGVSKSLLKSRLDQTGVNIQYRRTKRIQKSKSPQR